MSIVPSRFHSTDILQIGYIVFELFLFGSAFADNFATIVVTRFFGGGASSVAINIVGGSISDIWKGDKARSLPMSLFGFTSVAGIALGPFVGSAIVQIRKPNSGLESPWRWQAPSRDMMRCYADTS